MKTAFIALRSPQEADPSHAIRRFAEKDDATVILFEDGVYNAVHPKASEGLGAVAHEVFVCSEDLEARGFSPADLKVGKAVGYPEIIDCIMERTERTLTI